MAFVKFAFFSKFLPISPKFSPFSQKPSPLFLNTFPLSDLDETSYIDSFLDGICVVSIFYSKSSAIVRFGWDFLNRFMLGWYLGCMHFFQNSIHSLNSPPHPHLPFPKTIPPIFEPFPIIRFGWNFLHRFILGCHLWGLHRYSKTFQQKKYKIDHISKGKDRTKKVIYAKNERQINSNLPWKFDHFWRNLNFWAPKTPLLNARSAQTRCEILRPSFF